MNRVFLYTTYAYLDLGTGSQVTQIIIAVAVGFLYSVKIYYKRIIFLLKNIFTKKNGQ